MMRVTVLAGITGLFLAALAVVIWQSAESGSDEAGAGPLFDGIAVYDYRGPLGADEHPSVWIDWFPTVVLVTVEETGEARWSTPSGKFEGFEEIAAFGSLIYTPTTLRIAEYIKGSGEKTLQVAMIGGVVDGVTMDMQIPITVGDRAVLFLREAPSAYVGPIVDNAYVIDGDGAYSDLDQKQLSVADLLSGLRTAAAASASE